MSETITTRTGPYYGEVMEQLVWEIVDEQGVAAELYVQPTHRMIMAVEVRADRRGDGLARALYEAATATGTIYHVPAWGCTEDGLAFAEAMGGETMDGTTAAEITGFDLTLLD